MHKDRFEGGDRPRHRFGEAGRLHRHRPGRPGDERGHRHHPGGRGRAQRGDVRAAVLLLLDDQPMHGYQLMQAISERTEGAWRPSPGAVYPTIAQLEDEGLVSVVTDAGRKLVTLTDAGREYMTAQRASMVDPFAANHGDGGRDLRRALQQIHAAARAVVMGGSPDQITAAGEILAQARRALYLLLAEEESHSGDGPSDLGSV